MSPYTANRRLRKHGERLRLRTMDPVWSVKNLLRCPLLLRTLAYQNPSHLIEPAANRFDGPGSFRIHGPFSPYCLGEKPSEATISMNGLSPKFGKRDSAHAFRQQPSFVKLDTGHARDKYFRTAKIAWLLVIGHRRTSRFPRPRYG